MGRGNQDACRGTCEAHNGTRNDASHARASDACACGSSRGGEEGSGEEKARLGSEEGSAKVKANREEGRQEGLQAATASQEGGQEDCQGHKQGSLQKEIATRAGGRQRPARKGVTRRGSTQAARVPA